MHKHIIGIYYDCDNTNLCSLEDLKRKINLRKQMNEFYIKNNYPDCCYRYTKLEDFLDKRKDTRFKRFSYCPLCGEKINYRKILEENKTI